MVEHANQLRAKLHALHIPLIINDRVDVAIVVVVRGVYDH